MTMVVKICRFVSSHPLNISLLDSVASGISQGKTTNHPTP